MNGSGRLQALLEEVENLVEHFTRWSARLVLKVLCQDRVCLFRVAVGITG